jgi:CRP/FNR family transcriptional regulator, cyclic AMP receptor protein
MKKILLIEDNDHIRENTAEILELANYNVVTAADGKLGVESALKNKPDLIICDIMMPVLDGYGVLHMLHKNKNTQETPFIFLSARTERNDIRKGMDIGADDYITKPFVATELLNAIESRLKRASLFKHDGVESSPAVTASSAGINTNEMIAQFVANRNVIRYKKKQIIYSEGNHPSALYYVLKGKAKSLKTNDDGKELAIDLFSELDFIGYTALLDGSTYKETVVAMTDTDIAVIPRKEFEDLITSQWDVARKFIKMMANNVAEKEEHLIGLAYNSLRKKVAEALLKLQHKFGSDAREGFKMDFSRENLATIAGTATESLIRTLGDFREEKLIDIKNGQIYILNEKRLKDMMN